jgi:glycosyltransferase involved in cell wall biosynthesis
MLAGPRPRILILIKGLGLGGAERLIADALPHLDRDRFEYEFAYLLPWKDHLVGAIEGAGFEVHCLGEGPPTTDRRPQTVRPTRWREVLVLARGLVALWRLQRARGYDLIQADLPLAGLLARLVGRATGRPAIYIEHNLPERYRRLTRWLNGRTYSWNAAAVAVSEEVADSVRRQGLADKTRLVTVPNGVPVEAVRAEAGDGDGLRAELGIPDGRPVVGTVAVFRASKRLGDWLVVAARVAEERPEVTFLLAGAGPEEGALRARAEALGLGARLRMPGFRPDGRRLMGLMDVYLMTSEYEGLPLALLEAMALGVPAVATAVGGVPEAVEDGQNGLLAGVGQVEELAGQVLRLLDDGALRARLGQRAAADVEARFDTQRRVQAMEGLYLEVLEEGGGSVGD